LFDGAEPTYGYGTVREKEVRKSPGNTRHTVTKEKAGPMQIGRGQQTRKKKEFESPKPRDHFRAKRAGAVPAKIGKRPRSRELELRYTQRRTGKSRG